MVQEQTKNTFGLCFTYEQADEFVTRATGMLLERWSTFFDQMEENESFLLSRLKQIDNYSQATKGDEYLANLWLVWIGSRSEGVTLRTALERMEKVRELLEETKNVYGQPKLPGLFIPQIVNDDQPATKLKHILRFSIAKQLTSLIYPKLVQMQSQPGLSTDLAFTGDPYMFADKLKGVLKVYK